MNARTTTKQVKHEVEGEERTFIIHKMTALEGGCLSKFVVGKILPLIGGAQEVFGDIEEGETEQEVIAKRMDGVMKLIPEALESISDKELIDFEKRCLRTVDIIMDAGPQRVMIGDNFGCDEIECDTLTCLLLCYEVVEFNFSGFFGGKSLASILHRQASSPQNA